MSDSHPSIGDVTLMALLKTSTDAEVSDQAAELFCTRYMEKLLALIDRNLAAKYSPRVDPEDLAQSILRSWFIRAREGRIELSSQDEVWKLLSTVALNKVRNKVKFHDRKRRAVSQTNSAPEILQCVPEPTQEDAAAFLDLVEVAGQRLDEKARRTLELIVEGKSVEEIADELGRTTKSVSRYKKQIGTVLQQLLDDDLQKIAAAAEQDADDQQPSED